MSAWTKYFIDGTTEKGNDIDITRRKASWSKGRLKDIVGVMLHSPSAPNMNNICRVFFPDSEWHQFDNMIVPVSVGTHIPQRISRTVQVKIKTEHIGGYILERINDSSLVDNRSYRYYKEINNEEAHAFIKIESKYLNKWFTITISDTDYSIGFYDKGQING